MVKLRAGERMPLSVVRDIAEVSYIVKAVASVPIYTVKGVARGGYLVYSSTEEYAHTVYALDLSRGSRKLIAHGVDWQVVVHRDSSRVVFLRDVARGFELSRVFSFDLERDREEVISKDVEPQRIVGLAFDCERVAWSGATKETAGVYLAKLSEGRVERVAETKGREIVSDVNSRYIVGYGYIRGDPLSTELFKIDLATGDQKTYTPREGSTNLSPRLRWNEVLFASNFEDGDRFRLYVLDLESGELRRAKLSHSDMDELEPVEFVDYGWTEEGLIWAIAKRRGTSKLFLDGALIGLDFGFISSATVHGREAYVVHSSLSKPPSIIAINLLSKYPKVLVEARLPEDIENRLGEVRLVEVESYDGLKIPTYVLESRVAPKPGPAVVYPHGGPWSEVEDSWWSLLAGLAALGYHVIAPNFRGSTGYGERFRRMIIGDPGGADVEDVVAARDWAVESGLSSEGLVSIVGYSYGGYMSLMQLTKKPKLWRCGVAGAPVTDWAKMYESSDLLYKTFIEVLFGSRKELFPERSPESYVESIEAPLSIIHPQNDSRTPVQPVLEFVEKLVRLGKSFELHILPDVGHLAIIERESLAKFLMYVAIFLGRCYSSN
ncbi:MAG: S9 family peptidase [Sulfolobales archaeon]